MVEVLSSLTPGLDHGNFIGYFIPSESLSSHLNSSAWHRGDSQRQMPLLSPTGKQGTDQPVIRPPNSSRIQVEGEARHRTPSHKSKILLSSSLTLIQPRES